jgi:hypothetical protein
VVGLREWLLGIVKQAIREVEAESKRAAFSPTGELLGTVAIGELQTAMRGVVGDNPDAMRFMGGKPMNAITNSPGAQPVSFEQLQDVALRDQDAYWTKKVPSDV